jgi:dihydroorotase
MQTLTLIKPDDWHLHLRDGKALVDTVPHTARRFGRAIVMPNLKPPITTVEMADAYRQRILAALPEGSAFDPLMTLYLTESTTATDVAEVATAPHVEAIKLYPAGATTNSDGGVGKLDRVYPILEAMARHDLPLLIHGEVVDSDADIFDRERLFIERELLPIVARFPSLRIVLEHITTRDAVEFVRSSPDNIAATITAHHLLFNRNAMLAGGFRPHLYCLPVLKRETHRQALIDAATSGSAKFFLGTDSAPHAVHNKETACGCAGCFTAHAAIELYATAFEAAGKLDLLEGFASIHGPNFYRLPVNSQRIVLERTVWNVPADLPFGEDTLVPLMAGTTIYWRLRN